MGKGERYVSFESLLMTNRAVVKRSNWLVVHTAGENPSRFWLEFEDTKTAKRAGGSLLRHIREKRARGECLTDYRYNETVLGWFDRLLEAGYVKNRKETDEQHGA